MKIPVYVSGSGTNKYNNIYPCRFDISGVTLNQEYPEGFFGLYGNAFYGIFKDRTTEERYYFPVIVSMSGVADIIEKIVINNSVLSDIRNKNCKILIVSPYEGWGWNYYKPMIDKIVSKFSLGYQDFVLFDGNLVKHPEIKSVYFNFWERQPLYKNLQDLQVTAYRRLTSDNHRSQKFIYLNRRPHSARIAAVTLMYKMRKHGLLSLGLDGQMGGNYIVGQLARFEQLYPNIYKTYKEIDLYPKLPLTINDGIDAEAENPVDDLSVDKFYDSYLHVVAETYHGTNTSRMFFSEKVFKPIMFLQPFVIFGQPHSLKYLKEMGYKTFSAYIDESYDEIENDEDRLYESVNAVKKFIKKDKTEMHKVMQEMAPILIHNISHLQYRTMVYDEEIRKQLKDILDEV